MKLLAVITEPHVVDLILSHLKASAKPGRPPPLGSPHALARPIFRYPCALFVSFQRWAARLDAHGYPDPPVPPTHQDNLPPHVPLRPTTAYQAYHRDHRGGRLRQHLGADYNPLRVRLHGTLEGVFLP